MECRSFTKNGFKDFNFSDFDVISGPEALNRKFERYNTKKGFQRLFVS